MQDKIYSLIPNIFYGVFLSLTLNNIYIFRALTRIPLSNRIEMNLLVRKSNV